MTSLSLPALVGVLIVTMLWSAAIVAWMSRQYSRAIMLAIISAFLYLFIVIYASRQEPVKPPQPRIRELIAYAPTYQPTTADA